MAFLISPRSSDRQLDSNRADVLIEPFQLARAGNGHDPGFLRQQPGQCNLCRGGILLFGDLLKQFHHARLALIASGVKRGLRLRMSVLSKVVFSSILPVRYPRPSGLYGTSPMPSSSQVGRTDFFDLSPPDRIFALQGSDRLNGMGAADLVGIRFGQTKVLDLACLNQILDRASHIFHRHIWIGTVLVEQVDDFDSQALERSLSHPLDLLWAAIHPNAGTAVPFLRASSQTSWRSPPVP